MKFTSATELSVLFDQMADAVYLLDPETSNILWCNRPAYEVLGLKKDDILNHSVLSLQKDVVGLPQWSDIAQAIFSTQCYTFVGRHRHQNGGEIPVEVNTTHFEFDGGRYFLSVARNIQNRMALERDMQTRNHSLWFALNEAADGIWEWEIDTGHVFFSPQLKAMLGYGPDELLPELESWSKNIHPDDREYTLQVLHDHLNGYRRIYEAQYRLRNRNGHFIWVHDRGKVCQRTQQGEPTHVVGMVQNITEHKQLQNQLETLASHDVLTELPNRREGEKQAERILAQGKRDASSITVAVIDFDRFKRINDQYGHQKGDEVIVFGAKLLSQNLRESDFIYRWGGEEFVLLLPATDLASAPAVCDKLHDIFAEADWDQLGVPPVTLSIGLASYPEDGLEFYDLLAKADKAVYAAKNSGRDQTVLANALEHIC